MEAKKVNKVNPKKGDAGWDLNWDAFVKEWEVMDAGWELTLPDDWCKVSEWEPMAKEWDVMDMGWEPTLPDDWDKI